MVLKFCASISFLFNETDNLLERYQLAAKHGFKAVEVINPYAYTIDELVKAKAEADVEQILINSYPGNAEIGEFGLAAVPGRQQEFKDSLDKTIQYAKALGCKKIHILSGKQFACISDSGMGGIYKENLEYAAKVLEENDLIGLVEPISNEVIPNYFMNSFDLGLQLMQEINSPNLRLQLDIFHLQMLKGNLTANIKAMLPHTGHIQISQAPHRQGPDSLGEINYEYILQVLDELGYEDYIGLEYRPTTTTDASFDWIEKWGYKL